MQIYSILPLISAIFVFSLGLFVFSKNRKSKLNFLFMLFCFSITIWLFGTFMMLKVQEDVKIIFWDRFIYMGVVFIPIFAYHFSLILTKIKNQRTLLFLGYIISFFFFAVSQTDYFVSGLFRYKWGVHTEARFFHHFFLINFFLFVILFFLNIYRYYKKIPKAIEKSQIRYIFLAFFILTLGAFGFLPAYRIPIYPITYLGGVFFTIILAYAITKYRLMNIKIVITRGILYAFLIFYVASAFIFLSFLVGQFLKEAIGFNLALTTLLVSLIIVLSIDPLKKFFAQLTDKIFFKGKIDYSRVLRKLSKIVAEELNLNRLLKLLTESIAKELKIKKVFILMADEKEDFFYSKNHEKKIKINSKSPLINLLKAKQEIIITEEIERKINDLEECKIKKDLERARFQLEKFGAALCAPVVIGQKLTSILFLSRKFSGDMYTHEDLKLFEVLVPQLGAALEKSKLYEEVQSFSEKLKIEIKKATQKLKEANIYLQQLDQVKTEFISVASHQLRTPLSSLKGYLSMLLEGDFGRIKPKQKKILEDLFENTNRLIRLVNLMLNISRIEAGRLELEKKPTQIESLIEEILRIFIPIARRKKLKLKFEKSSTSLPFIMLDSDKIKDVISNLLDNAIKYTPQGEITVKTKREKSKIIFSIQDTGIGITERECGGLFKKFSRGSRAKELHTGGTGLGLFIVEKIIEAHGGKIWVESEGEGKGSIFSFSLPIIFEKLPK